MKSLPFDTTRSATDDLVGPILSLLQSGQIKPDKRIGEASLSHELGLPRSQVRAALERLKESGILTRVSRSGTFVRNITMDNFCESMDVRAALEALAIRLFCTRATVDQLKELKSLAVRIDAFNEQLIAGKLEVYASQMELDLKFHGLIAEGSGNTRLYETLRKERLIEYTFRCLEKNSHILAPSPGLPIPTHQDIVEALEARDVGKAESTIRQHILRTKSLRLLRYTGEMT